ncbi:MAG TPA: adenylate/guanylate cyclase domain-containing protein [Acidimicrobiales bacterium]|nr:adenylate/guanylate cyclase domain-containing protein [Acidimicrobiales bacterium]
MRVPRCFAFIDLSGFTALTARQGDERAVLVLSAFRALVRDICSRRGVRIAKWLGDGAMLVGVETRPVVEAILEMQLAAPTASEEMAIRCGVSVGEVILHEGDDYIGHAVNVAARLCDMAQGGEILAAEEVADEVPRWGAVLTFEDMIVRSLQRPVKVARLGMRQLEGDIRPDPVCGIPLSRPVAARWAHDGLGRELWFCSDSCLDTWQRRPAPALEEPGSVRTPFIGS